MIVQVPNAGVYIFHFAPRGKNKKKWMAGEKYYDLIKKNIRGKRWENGGEGKIFNVLWVKTKNIIFEKRGWGNNILFSANIHPCPNDEKTFNRASERYDIPACLGVELYQTLDVGQ